jgi:predicted transcriptional regulator
LAKSIHDQRYQDLIARLVEARHGSGLTQQVLAERLGKPQSYVAKVEGLERRLDVIEFLLIFRELGSDPMPMLEEAWVQIRRQ